jgi:hypothetical protein
MNNLRRHFVCGLRLLRHARDGQAGHEGEAERAKKESAVHQVLPIFIF